MDLLSQLDHFLPQLLFRHIVHVEIGIVSVRGGFDAIQAAGLAGAILLYYTIHDRTVRIAVLASMQNTAVGLVYSEAHGNHMEGKSGVVRSKASGPRIL
jgi:hypothetical protein